jgi:hypothetical protein
MTATERRRLPAWTWLVAAIAVSLAQVAAHLVDFGVYDLRIGALDSNSDSSLVAWLTPLGMALVLAGVAAGAAQSRLPRAPSAVAGALLAGLILVAVVRRGAFGPAPAVVRSTIVLAPLLAVVLLLLLRLGLLLPGDTRRILVSGCVLLVCSYGLQLVARRLATTAEWPRQTWRYEVAVASKEGAEVAGWLAVGLACCVGAAGARRPEPTAGRPAPAAD